MKLIKTLYGKSIQLMSKYFTFLFFLPLFFILHGYNQLFGFIPFNELLLNFGSVQLFTIISFYLAKLFFQTKQKAAIFALVSTLITLLFGYIHDVFKELFYNTLFNKYLFLLPLLALLLIYVAISLYKNKKDLKGVVLYLNTLMICIFVSEIYNSVRTYKKQLIVKNLIDPNFTVLKEYQSKKKISDSSKPDIYFLLFDEMAGSSGIKKEWGISNDKIDSFLAKKGFYIVANSRSNYSWTVHSVSSTFNMMYLLDTLVPVLDDPKSYLYATNSFRDNSLFSILKNEGYTLHEYQNISFTMKNMPSKPYFSTFRQLHFYYKTLPGRIQRDLFWRFNFKQNIDNKKKEIADRDTQIKFIIKKVKESVSKSTSPKFVYAHFLMPHYPYFYDSSGKFVNIKNIPGHYSHAGIKGYQQQLYYADKVIEDLVTHIQLNNKKKSVIIVAGDHGFRYYQTINHESLYKNFLSIYFPDSSYNNLYQNLSSVNIFRIVLNKYFNANLQLLKDTSIYVPAQNQKRDIK